MIEINLGDKVRSKVSGFLGTITAKHEYLYGTTSYAVTAPEMSNGNVKTEWFAAGELDIELSDIALIDKSEIPYIRVKDLIAILEPLYSEAQVKEVDIYRSKSGNIACDVLVK